MRGTLYKRSKNAIISGVCAGIADFLHVPRLLVRVIFVVEGAVLAYFLLAMYLPSDEEG